VVLDEALRYADYGWYVLPLHTASGAACTCPKRHACPSPAKHPRIRQWPRNATRDKAKIKAWWMTWPDSNIGIVTGQVSGIVALDIDPNHGGEESLAALLRANGGEWPPTVAQHTGSGGRHMLFAYPGHAIRNSAGRLGLGLDIRGDGGYIVAPPSRHVSGGTYSWVQHPDEARLAPMPPWLVALLSAEPSIKPVPMASQARIGEGERNSHLASIGGKLRRQGKSRSTIETALLQENAATCHPPLTVGEVRQIAASVAGYGTSPLHTWRDLIRSIRGPKHPITRYVLINLSTYMDENGRRCFPSIDRQAIETGLSVTTIKRHLHEAEQTQWIYIYERQGQGKAWRHYEYTARIPDMLVSESHHDSASTCPPNQDGGVTQSIGGVTESPDTPIYNH